MRNKLSYLIAILPLCFAASSCDQTSSFYEFDETVTNENGSAYYEIFVRSFYDTDNNGLGDLQGVKEKLPYLAELGVKGIWLMPIHPSDTYHKYDVKDYVGIDSEYGTLDDFDDLITEANQHHIDIIIDLVINHSSVNHPWFIEAQNQKRNNACSALDSKCRYYNWSDAPQEGYRWSSLANSHYEGRFDSSMPDLNLDNEYVVSEFEDIVDFWLNRGVKGFRLDAVTSFYTDCMEKNVQFLANFNNYVKSVEPDAFIIGEAWENLTSILYQYASSGMHFFNFPLSETNNKGIAHSVMQMNGYDFSRTLVNSEVQIKQASQTSKNALIISNHDMDRSAGYLADEKAKLAASAYLLSPGHPFIYYGEEIGLRGSRGGATTDANRRLPMIWDKNDNDGLCDNPPGTTYDQTLQVENGVYDNLKIGDSLTNHYKKVLNVRNKYGIIHDGLYNYVDTGNAKIASFEVTKSAETLYLLHNFSNEVQIIELEVSGLNIIEAINVVGINPSLDGQTLSLAPFSSVIIQ